MNNLKRFEGILHKVSEEIDRQDRKWGKNVKQNPYVWLAILGEEVGEVNKAVLEGTKEDVSHLKEELVQVTAVCLQFLKDLDTHEN